MKTLDPITQDKQIALQLIINAQVFAPSTSALAKRLGYKGKTSIYRIQQGEASAGAIEEAWEKLKLFVGCNDDLLYTLARAVGYTTNLKRLVRNEGEGLVEKKNHHKWVLLNILKQDEHGFSEDFQHDVWPDIMEIRDNDETAFWMMMALYYFDAEGADAYSKDFDLLASLKSMHRLLQLNYESSERSHRGASNVIRKEYLASYCRQCTWDLIYYGYIVIMQYADPDAMEKLMVNYVTYNLGENSFWRVPDTIYEKGAHIWHLLEMQMMESRHGTYYAIELEMGRNKEEFRLIQIAPMLFNEEQDFVQLEVTDKRIPIIGQYEWADDYHTLQLILDKEAQQTYGIPRTLHRIDLANPQGKDEKIWANVLKGYDKQLPAHIEEALYHFEGIEDMDSEYDIVNVTIDRHTLTIRLTDKNDGKGTDYSINIREYEFLRTLLPSDIVSIVCPLMTGEPTFHWALRGHMIAMKEFTKNPID